VWHNWQDVSAGASSNGQKYGLITQRKSPGTLDLYLIDPASKEKKLLAENVSPAMVPMFDPKSGKIFYLADRGGLTICAISSGKEEKLLAAPSSSDHLVDVISSKKRILFKAHRWFRTDYYLYDLENNKLDAIDIPTDTPWNVNLSASGNYLIYSDKGCFFSREIATGKLRNLTEKLTGMREKGLFCGTISPDDRYFCYRCGLTKDDNPEVIKEGEEVDWEKIDVHTVRCWKIDRRQFVLVDLKTQEFKIIDKEKASFMPVFSPDSKKLFYSDGPSLRVYDINSGKTNKILCPVYKFERFLNWAGNNQLLFRASTGAHGKDSAVYRCDPDGSNMKILWDTVNNDSNKANGKNEKAD
jgi:Tol biopolymer transport system component